MKIILSPATKIFISRSPIKRAGRGVFASRPIKKGALIERCPVFVLPKKDYKTAKKTAMREYYFMWGSVTSAICFGYGSLYNHSYAPNATYRKKIKEQIVEFIAIKDIRPDEEITVNYNYGQPANRRKLWIKKINQA